MTSARGFAVETASEVALVVSDDQSLPALVVSSLLENGFEVRSSGSHRFFAEAETSSGADLDYCVIFGSKLFLDQVNSHSGKLLWAQFVAGLNPATKVYFIAYLGDAVVLPVFPASFHICLFGDFIGDFGGQSPLIDRFLAEARKSKSLTIPADGLGLLHLLDGHDLREGLRGLVMDPSPPKLLHLVHPEGVSLLSVAYHLRSALPFKIDILFDESAPWSGLPLDWEKVRAGQSKIAWRPARNFTDSLSGYIDRYFETQPETAPLIAPIPPSKPAPVSAVTAPSPGLREEVPISSAPPPVFVPVVPARRRPRLTPLKAHLKIKKPALPLGWRIALSSLGFAGFLYLFSLFVCGTITVLSVKNLIVRTGQGELLPASAVSVAKPSAVYLQANLTAVASFPGLKNSMYLRDSNRLLSAYILALQTSASASELAVVGRDIAGYVLGEGEGDIVSSLNVAGLATAKLYDDLSLLDGTLPADPPSIIPNRYKSSYITTKSRMQEARRAVLTGKSLLSVAPDILGVGDRRKYVVLFQNNMELRPTGGFIGSFAIISLENGKLFDIDVQDVYAADGQLKGHVEPPEEIRKFLGEANWYLRDSNWDPDFPTTARRVEWFLGKTISQDVQGVIGINVFTLQDILSAVGTVHIADYDENITSENIFERAEYHAEINFFPGSTQKKEFIGSVADTLIGKLKNLPAGQILDLTRALTKSIDEKNTLLSLGDTSTGRALSALGWSGELRDLPCPELGVTKSGSSTACASDFAMLVDSNFGINKANYFIKRQLDLSVLINSDFSLSHELKIKYTNTAKSSAWPAGAYKSYSRLYLPLGSVVSDVSVGEKILKKEDIKISTEHGRTIAGFLIDVPLDSTVEVKVVYATPSALLPSDTAYSLYWQKQSGTAADPLSIHISYPSILTPEIVSPKGEFRPGTLDFTLTNVTDRRITVKFE